MTNPDALSIPCKSCHAAAGAPCTTGTGKPRGPHAPRTKALESAAWKVKAAKVRTARRSFDAAASARAIDAVACPVCERKVGSVCFEPLTRSGSRWTPLTRDTAHQARIDLAEKTPVVAAPSAPELCPKCNAPKGWHAGTKCLDAETYADLAEEDAAIAVLACPKCHTPAGRRCKSGIGCSERIALVEAYRAAHAEALELDAARTAALAKPIAAVSRRVVLVSCGLKKAPSSAPAAELYIGNVFRAARGYAEASGSPWFILSAKHGLVAPDQVVAPYDATMTEKNEAEREAWARAVVDELEHRFPHEKVDLEVLAGEKYEKPLRAELERRLAHRRAWYLEAPLAGLEVGERLAWFKERREEREIGDASVGCQAVRHYHTSRDRGTEAFDELGIELPGKPMPWMRACGRRATEIVTLKSGAKVWACANHARRHERSEAGLPSIFADLPGRQTKPQKTKAVRWVERSNAASYTAEMESEEAFRRSFRNILAEATPAPEPRRGRKARAAARTAGQLAFAFAA